MGTTLRKDPVMIKQCSSLGTAALALLLSAAVACPTCAGSREKKGSHPDRDAIRAGLATNMISIKLTEVWLTDVALMFSMISTLPAEGMKLSPAARKGHLSIDLQDASMVAALDEVCTKTDLFWRIDEDCLYIFAAKESNTSWSSTREKLKKSKPPWPKLSEKTVEMLLRSARKGDWSEKTIYKQDFDGWTFSWTVKKQGTNYVVVRHEAKIE